MAQKQQDPQQEEAPEIDAPNDEESAMEEVQEDAARERENERGYQ